MTWDKKKNWGGVAASLSGNFAVCLWGEWPPQLSFATLTGCGNKQGNNNQEGPVKAPKLSKKFFPPPPPPKKIK